MIYAVIVVGFFLLLFGSSLEISPDFVVISCDIGFEDSGKRAIFMGEADLACILVETIVSICFQIVINGD